MEKAPSYLLRPANDRSPVLGSRLMALRTGEVVHGLGEKPLADYQRRDLEGLLSGIGFSINDPLMEHLRGEVHQAMWEYARTPVGMPERKELARFVKEELEQARQEHERSEAA